MHNLLLSFVNRYLSLDRDFNTSEDELKYLIFDDTDIENRGKKIERISKTFNHVHHRFIFGFKLIGASYWNRNAFIPVDFNFHSENKDNKRINTD